MADIRDPQGFMKGRWNYDALGVSRAFPGKISPTDIDAMVEINQHHLFLEHKEYHPDRGEPSALPLGQRIALERLARKDKMMVLHIAGIAEHGRAYIIENIGTRQKLDMRDMSDDQASDYLFAVLEKWAINAQATR